jgi:hypothetical protein
VVVCLYSHQAEEQKKKDIKEKCVCLYGHQYGGARRGKSSGELMLKAEEQQKKEIKEKYVCLYGHQYGGARTGKSSESSC